MENFVYIIVTPAGLTICGNIREIVVEIILFMLQCCQIREVSRLRKVYPNDFQLEQNTQKCGFFR